MTTTAKDAARSTVEELGGSLVDQSHRIHASPELAFQEERAAGWVAEALTAGGLTVEAGGWDLPTALVATAGSGPLTLAICAEYDALPGIGHACGHNVIAAAGVGAGLALAPLADDLGITLKVFGTPAEEKGGGKCLMLERGAFEGVHAAMMVHPSPMERDRMACLAVAHLDVAYRGKSAHASASPEQGFNAADALTVAQVGVGLLRQHITSTDRIHGIVTDGGDAPNIVPERTGGSWYVRSRTLKDLEGLVPKVERCFEAGATATGCSVEVTHGSRLYSEFEHDDEMVAVYRRNAEELGRVFTNPPGAALDFRYAGSTDMANVSLAIPSIHPMLGLDSFPAVNHQPEFTAFCATPVADKAALQGAMAMAWTCIDLAQDDAQRERLTA